MCTHRGFAGCYIYLLDGRGHLTVPIPTYFCDGGKLVPLPESPRYNGRVHDPHVTGVVRVREEFIKHPSRTARTVGHAVGLPRQWGVTSPFRGVAWTGVTSAACAAGSGARLPGTQEKVVN